VLGAYGNICKNCIKLTFSLEAVTEIRVEAGKKCVKDHTVALCNTWGMHFCAEDPEEAVAKGEGCAYSSTQEEARKRRVMLRL
jgi:hypothetical protein